MRDEDIGKGFAIRVKFSQRLIHGRIVGIVKTRGMPFLGVFCTPGGSVLMVSRDNLITSNELTERAIGHFEKLVVGELYKFNPTSVAEKIQTDYKNGITVQQLLEGRNQARNNAWELISKTDNRKIFA